MTRMPNNYKRTSNRHSWSKEDMAKAIQEVREKKCGWLLASKKYGVPQATLRRHFKQIPQNLGRFKPTFGQEVEKHMVQHILEFENRFFGFTTTDVRKLAFEFAEKAGVNHKFDKETQMAGWDWLHCFRARNPRLALRSPEPTSAARAMAFNKPQVMKFFAMLEEILTDIPPQRIYNMDESGLSTVQKPPKIFALKGKKQVGALTSAERGQHVTVVVCASATGNLVPPALIFPRKNHKREFFDGAPAGSLELCYESGYMVGELFCKWMKHFVQFSGCSLENKVLLILDGHGSHKNLNALEFAKANGVIMLCLPPHCTHRIQPLDVSFFGPLDAYFNREITTWLKNHPGRTVGLYQISALFGKAYGSAASVGNITSGFEKTGIYPFNPSIFPEHMFLPSDVTENVLNADPDATNPVTESPEHTDANEAVVLLNEPSGLVEPIDIPGPSSSSAIPLTSMMSCDPEQMLKTISPLPKATGTGQLRNSNRRKVTGSQLLTDSPFINEVRAQVQAKKEKEHRRSLREHKQTKRVLILDTENVQPDFSDDDEDVACIYCNELYSRSRPGEHWLSCQACTKWCHALCAGVDHKVKQFVCELCKDDDV